MHCPHCETDNRLGAKFCKECGGPLPLACSSCGADNASDAKFCDACGASLIGQTSPVLVLPQETPAPVTSVAPPIEGTLPPASPRTPDAERRQLTVMFCDLVGSTNLSGQLDPEELRNVIRAYQASCDEVIRHFSGHVAQHLGDGLLIYFGYPAAHEDDPARAVRTGLGIIDAMQTLNQRLATSHGIQLAVRMGVHTGLVVVGDMGAGPRQEQLALGEAPNIAARIQSLAEPDTVVISAATYRLVEGYFECETLGDRALKGVADSVTVYDVLTESRVQGRLDIARAHGLTPLVGRESEVTLLVDRWGQVKSSQGQVVLLSGEAGIGKSRLIQVLREQLDTEPHTRLECRSSPYYGNTALYPVIDLLQRTLAVQITDTPEARLQKLETALSQYQLQLDEAVPLFAALLSVPMPEDRYAPLDLAPERQRQKTFEALLAILLELAKQQPLLFILEDLHWTDPTTLEFIGLILDQVPTASILLFLTTRPEFNPPWGNRSYLTQLTLNRLSPDQIGNLAIQAIGGVELPVEVIERLVQQTDGVPLFVEEMTKAIVESGILKEVAGQYELLGSLDSLAIPATLQDSLMARLDRLVTAKGLAQQASVIGRQFSFDVLQAVSQLDESVLRHELKRLVDAELLYQRGLPPQSTYTFKHALIQDTAYESLLRTTRQQVHRRIVQVLEEQFPETAQIQPEVVAYHATEAGLHEPAVKYWRQAGREAVRRSANREAIEHYQKALNGLNGLPDTPERTEQEITLLIALCTALVITEGYGSAHAKHVLTQAHELCQTVEDSPHLFSTLLELGRNALFHAEYQRVRELGEQLLDLAERLQEPEHFLEAHFTLGTAWLWMGELEISLFHIQKSYSLYQSQQNDFPILVSGHDHEVGCLTYEARILWFLGYPDRALAQSYEALTRGRALSHPNSQARALSFVAFLHYYRREVRQTQACTEELLVISREHDYVHWVPLCMILRGWALAMQGEVENGICQIQEGMADQERIGHRHARIWWLLILAEAHCVGNQVADGLHVLAEAVTVIEQTGQRVLEAEAYRLKGEFLLQLLSDNAAEAEDCFHDAMTIAQNQSAKSLELRAATRLARLWQNQGNQSEAHELLAPVYGWFSEGFDTVDLKDAKVLLGELAEKQ